jgi:hypothetical protein
LQSAYQIPKKENPSFAAAKPGLWLSTSPLD